jgi:hypothetical protein
MKRMIALGCMALGLGASLGARPAAAQVNWEGGRACEGPCRIDLSNLQTSALPSAPEAAPAAAARDTRAKLKALSDKIYETISAINAVEVRLENGQKSAACGDIDAYPKVQRKQGEFEAMLKTASDATRQEVESLDALMRGTHFPSFEKYCANSELAAGEGLGFVRNMKENREFANQNLTFLYGHTPD